MTVNLRPFNLSLIASANNPSTSYASSAFGEIGIAFLLTLLLSTPLLSQFRLDGHLKAKDTSNSFIEVPLSTIIAIAHQKGEEAEALSFRTFEMHPAGWFRLSGVEGDYTLAFTNPAHYTPPKIVTNQFFKKGEKLHYHLKSSFDFANFYDKEWDSKPAKSYYQPFFAKGTSITSVGFKLATDGVDGSGPKSQEILVSIHEIPQPVDSESALNWPQIGPTMPALNVDCGGPKNYWYSVGWNSGEVPVKPGRRYAVQIRPKDPTSTIQAFWKHTPSKTPGIFRTDETDNKFEPFNIWLAVGSTDKGLTLPYNKRVHHKFSELSNIDQRWSQTWVAQGKGLASVVLYAAVSGKQPPLNRQRVRVRVREDGPQGKVVGIEKIAVGNGNYTGDASWGHFVAAFSPNEVPLVPGEKYAIEFETIETFHTIGDFVNIKKQVSSGIPGFNPYKKCAPDKYPAGTAYRGKGARKCDFDLDMQIVEYVSENKNWSTQVQKNNLILQGEMNSFHISNEAGEEYQAGWKTFNHTPDSVFFSVEKSKDGNSYFQLAMKSPQKSIDAGWVQRVSNLSNDNTYKLTGKVRSTWPLSLEQRCEIGIDPTGQVKNSNASSIHWKAFPPRHGEFLNYTSAPIRPDESTLSIWLRARVGKIDHRFPFLGDFDAFALRKMDSGSPQQDQRQSFRGPTNSIPPESEGQKLKRLELVQKRRSYIPILVHRGATRFHPENTLEAFSAAIDRGADGIEVDIRRSTDGILYVFHDRTLDRMTDQTGNSFDKTYPELLSCRVGLKNYKIPTLASVFTLARDRGALIHLDVKEPGLEAAILQLIQGSDLWNHIVEVNAGNASTIRHHPKIKRLQYKGWFPQDHQKGVNLKNAQRKFLKNPGTMIFTKWDPIEAVKLLGRRESEVFVIPLGYWQQWE